MSTSAVLRSYGKFQPRRIALAILCVGLAATASYGQEEVGPEAILKSKGLRKSGAFYALPAEAQLAKLIQEINKQQRTLKASVKEEQTVATRLSTANQGLERINERLAITENVVERQRLLTQFQQLRDQVGALNREYEHLLAINRQSRQRYYSMYNAALEAHGKIQQTYAQLESDKRVISAMERLNVVSDRDYRLGPTAEFDRTTQALDKLTGALQKESIPLTVRGNVYEVDVFLNGRLTRPMILDSGASIVCLPYKLADEIGVVPNEGSLKITLKIADGNEIEGHMVKIPSVSVGQFKVENVDCAVLSAEFPNAPALLGNSFLRNFDYKIEAESGKLTLFRLE